MTDAYQQSGTLPQRGCPLKVIWCQISVSILTRHDRTSDHQARSPGPDPPHPAGTTQSPPHQILLVSIGSQRPPRGGTDADFHVQRPCTSTGCVKIKRPNTKTAISQKCVNIIASNFASLYSHITVHESVVSCCIYSTYAEMTET